MLIVGSGFLSHNLRQMYRDAGDRPIAWAGDFDAWAADAIARQDVDAIIDYRNRAPAISQALPTHEHFVPLLVALGADADRPGGVRFPITGFLAGTLTNLHTSTARIDDERSRRRRSARETVRCRSLARRTAGNDARQ